MARLILLNGLPGAGKSTLARRYVEDHPLSLALDIDEVRAMLGGWPDQRAEAGLIARQLAMEMTRMHLTSGRDVVIPQLVGKLPFVHALDAVCREAGARFVEVLLQLSPEEAASRVAERSRRHECAAHLDAHALLDSDGDIHATLRAYHRALGTVISDRPGTHIIASATGEIDATYRALIACCGA